MRLSTRLWLYLFALHLVFLAMSWRLFMDTPEWFALMEALLLCSLVGGGLLMRRALEPLDAARRFQELLQDRQYAARLHTGTSAELGQLVDLFNHLLETLHSERLRVGEQQGLLDRLLEATPNAVVVFDFDGRVSLHNAAANALLPDLGATDADERAALWAQLAATALGESRLVTTLAGQRYRVQRGQFFDRGFARHFLLIDELTQELASSERETYAKLIRVLAHEVNNTVAATGSVLESLTYYSDQLSEADRLDFTTAVRAVKHRNASLGAFIERFTRVVKMPEPERSPTSVVDLVASIARLYQEPCRAQGIVWEWTYTEDLPLMDLDRPLMEQALINLVKNAMEATLTTMASTPPGAPVSGRIAIALERRDNRLHLSITDSGNRLHDVPPGQLFSPFFTTKQGGQGIGLLFAREVLVRHGFSYHLAPTGTGHTRFDIGMPLTGTAPALSD